MQNSILLDRPMGEKIILCNKKTISSTREKDNPEKKLYIRTKHAINQLNGETYQAIDKMLCTVIPSIQNTPYKSQPSVKMLSLRGILLFNLNETNITIFFSTAVLTGEQYDLISECLRPVPSLASTQEKDCDSLFKFDFHAVSINNMASMRNIIPPVICTAILYSLVRNLFFEMYSFDIISGNSLDSSTSIKLLNRQ